MLPPTYELTAFVMLDALVFLINFECKMCYNFVIWKFFIYGRMGLEDQIYHYHISTSEKNKIRKISLNIFSHEFD